MRHANTYLNAPSITVRTTRTDMNQLSISGLEKAVLTHAFEGKNPDAILEFDAKVVDGRITCINNIRVV